jgi:hypothetical protein
MYFLHGDNSKSFYFTLIHTNIYQFSYEPNVQSSKADILSSFNLKQPLTICLQDIIEAFHVIVFFIDIDTTYHISSHYIYDIIITKRRRRYSFYFFFNRLFFKNLTTRTPL